MSSTRPQIPAEVKREVRQKCGFCCVVCGAPIFEYHHLDDWSDTEDHSPSNLILLCPNHHKDATSGLLTKDQILKHLDSSNGNWTGSRSLVFSGEQCEIKLGDSDWCSLGSPREFHAIVIDNQSLLGFDFEQGNLLLKMLLLDEMNQPLLHCVNGEISFTKDYWDINWVSNRLVLRDRLRHIRLDVEFEPPARVIVHSGTFLLNGVAVRIGNFGLHCYNNGVTWKFRDGKGGGEDKDSSMQIAAAFGWIHPGVASSVGVSFSGLRRYEAFDLWSKIEPVEIPVDSGTEGDWSSS